MVGKAQAGSTAVLPFLYGRQASSCYICTCICIVFVFVVVFVCKSVFVFVFVLEAHLFSPSRIGGRHRLARLVFVFVFVLVFVLEAQLSSTSGIVQLNTSITNRYFLELVIVFVYGSVFVFVLVFQIIFCVSKYKKHSCSPCLVRQRLATLQLAIN